MDGYLLDETACARLGKLFKLHESGRLVPKDSLGTLESLANPDLLHRQFKNDSGATIPAYGVVMLDDTEKIDEIEYLKVKKANDKFKRRYFVNGTQEVEDQKYGGGTWLSHSDWVLYDHNEGTPQIGEQWGVKPGEFKLFKHRPGFFITGGTTGSNSTNDLRVRAIQQTVEQVLGQPNALIDYLSFGNVTVY